VLLQDIESHL